MYVKYIRILFYINGAHKVWEIGGKDPENYVGLPQTCNI